MKEIVVVGYGAGNVASVIFALERLGARAVVTADAAEIAAAERLILPGVGHADYAMERLRALDLVEPLRAFRRPMLGICLGQQLLFESSAEGEGGLLGLIPGRVERLDPAGDRPIPHMGWSRLARRTHDPILEDVGDGDWAYFVHGYVCPDGSATLAATDYGGVVPAVVRQANRWGCQFHPERSSMTGARILRNFLELAA